jgi:hypothetical protein
MLVFQSINQSFITYVIFFFCSRTEKEDAHLDIEWITYVDKEFLSRIYSTGVRYSIDIPMVVIDWLQTSEFIRRKIEIIFQINHSFYF